MLHYFELVKKAISRNPEIVAAIGIGLIAKVMGAFDDPNAGKQGDSELEHFKHRISSNDDRSFQTLNDAVRSLDYFKNEGSALKMR